MGDRRVTKLLRSPVQRVGQSITAWFPAFRRRLLRPCLGVPLPVLRGIPALGRLYLRANSLKMSCLGWSSVPQKCPMQGGGLACAQSFSNFAPAMQNVYIKEVKTGREMDDFVHLPRRLYAGNSYYVPDLESDIRETFDPQKNAALEFSAASSTTAPTRSGTRATSASASSSLWTMQPCLPPSSAPWRTGGAVAAWTRR